MILTDNETKVDLLNNEAIATTRSAPISLASKRWRLLTAKATVRPYVDHCHCFNHPGFGDLLMMEWE